MSEAQIKVRIIRPTQGTGVSHADGSKRGSTISESHEQCKSCEERRRGHSRGEHLQPMNWRKKQAERYQEELFLLSISDIARSMRESIRLRKTLRV